MDQKMVKSPAHYTEGRKFEPKDVIRDWGLGFNLGSTVKYIARAGRKDDILQELYKAKEFLQFEIEAIEAEREKAVKTATPKHTHCRCVEPNNAYSINPLIDYENDIINGCVIEIHTGGAEQTLESIIEAFLSDIENAMREDE